ncbi:MAG: hypothetical protein NZM12_06085, partial [Steroidobacteraceae bacterium]|nr:hypothetical protein [Steroidobacteraceae bacterium]
HPLHEAGGFEPIDETADGDFADCHTVRDRGLILRLTGRRREIRQQAKLGASDTERLCRDIERCAAQSRDIMQQCAETGMGLPFDAGRPKGTIVRH